MNKDKQKEPHPSPRCSNARKPLINITNYQYSSLERRKEVPDKIKLAKPESTKSIRPKISVQEPSYPKIMQARSRKSIRSESANSDSSRKQIFCENHKKRTALHRIESLQHKYYCLECSFYYAKKGFKIQKIVNQDSEPSNTIKQRRNQANSYLNKCSEVHGELMKERKAQVAEVKRVYEDYGRMINLQKIKMEEEIKKIQQSYESSISKIERQREAEIQIYQSVGAQCEKLCLELSSTRIDIQNNMDTIVHPSFMVQQFRKVMDEYWNRVHKTHAFVCSNSIAKLSEKSNMKMTSAVSEKDSGEKSKEFTFSKEQHFQTPRFDKTLRGIKFADSIGQSDMNSSLKQSIVDRKYAFS